VEVKRPGREADHSSPSSPEVKNARSYASTPPYVFMARCLFKHRDVTSSTTDRLSILVHGSISKIVVPV